MKVPEEAPASFDEFLDYNPPWVWAKVIRIVSEPQGEFDLDRVGKFDIYIDERGDACNATFHGKLRWNTFYNALMNSIIGRLPDAELKRACADGDAWCVPLIPKVARERLWTLVRTIARHGNTVAVYGDASGDGRSLFTQFAGTIRRLHMSTPCAHPTSSI